MGAINWIILKSKDRGIEYGVGTFIKQLFNGLAAHNDIDIYLLEFGISDIKTFNLVKDGSVTIMKIPLKQNSSGSDTISNQKKIAKNIARIVTQYIPEKKDTIIHMNYLFQFFIASALKELLFGKIIFTQHVFAIGQSAINGPDFFDLECETYKSVDKIVTVTKHGKKHLQEKGVNENKIDTIYNGISPDIFSQNKGYGILEKYGLTKEEKIILYSGRIDPIKGLEYLCVAMERLVGKIPECRLVIAGDGNFESLIKASKKFSTKISFLGFIPFNDVVSLYHEADIGVIPSLEEHCSYVALEMLHCGLPVVASSLGGLKEIFVHGENALLANTVEDTRNMYGIAPDVVQFENHMYSLLTDKSLRLKLGVNAKKRANSNFTSDVMIDNYLRTIKKLTKNAQ